MESFQLNPSLCVVPPSTRAYLSIRNGLRPARSVQSGKSLLRKHSRVLGADSLPDGTGLFLARAFHWIDAQNVQLIFIGELIGQLFDLKHRIRIALGQQRNR